MKTAAKTGVVFHEAGPVRFFPAVAQRNQDRQTKTHSDLHKAAQRLRVWS
jgi:hypothetical protein